MDRGCCFVGARKFPEEVIGELMVKLNREVDVQIEQGVTDFICGGELGFDFMAASLVLSKREMGKNIRLVFVLTHPDQAADWADRERTLFRNLVGEADEVLYAADNGGPSCTRLRSREMVARSGCCISALYQENGAIAKTYRLARQKGLRLISLIG